MKKFRVYSFSKQEHHTIEAVTFREALIECNKKNWYLLGEIKEGEIQQKPRMI